LWLFISQLREKRQNWDFLSILFFFKSILTILTLYLLYIFHSLPRHQVSYSGSVRWRSRVRPRLRGAVQKRWRWWPLSVIKVNGPLPAQHPREEIGLESTHYIIKGTVHLKMKNIGNQTVVGPHWLPYILFILEVNGVQQHSDYPYSSKYRINIELNWIKWWQNLYFWVNWPFNSGNNQYVVVFFWQGL